MGLIILLRESVLIPTGTYPRYSGHVPRWECGVEDVGECYQVSFLWEWLLVQTILMMLVYVLCQLCEPLLSYHQYYAVAMQVLVGSMFAFPSSEPPHYLFAPTPYSTDLCCPSIVLCMMRIYALYDRSWRVLGFLIAVSIGSVVVACVSPSLFILSC